jgi:hypothetical protein
MASMRTYRPTSLGRGAILLAMMTALGACAHLGAPGPVVADRPGYTDTPVALPAGAVQLEAGATDDRVGPSDARTEYVSAGETLLRLGLGGRTEARLFGNSYGRRTVSGAGTTGGVEDFKLGAKLNLRSAPDSVHSWAPNIALLAATTLPTGASGFGASSSQPEVKVAMNWTTASPFSLYTNVGYGDIVNETGRAGKGWVSAASWWAINPRVSLFAEGLAIGRVRGSGSGTAGNNVDGGLTFLINDRFQLDVRVGRGLGRETGSERFVGGGLAKRW